MDENVIKKLVDRVSYLETHNKILNAAVISLINRELDRILASASAEKVKKYVT
jgi:hypothetical protein